MEASCGLLEALGALLEALGALLGRSWRPFYKKIAGGPVRDEAAGRLLLTCGVDPSRLGQVRPSGPGLGPTFGTLT